jgi:hypothetical protein
MIDGETIMRGPLHLASLSLMLPISVSVVLHPWKPSCMMGHNPTMLDHIRTSMKQCTEPAPLTYLVRLFLLQTLQGKDPLHQRVTTWKVFVDFSMNAGNFGII